MTRVTPYAQLQVDLVIAALAANRPPRLRSFLPIEREDLDKLRSQRPHRNASFIDDLTNESIAPHVEKFWAELPRWMRDGNILPTEYKVIKGLDKVKDINKSLDTYRDVVRVGPQTVVKIEG
ncbi:hypothetical protein MMC13_001330 [Lambiella insularis]|nr:hypothetical protein [Lambiella insularis]